jgi:pyridoxamine 5'-phosphate oxidase
MSVSIADIRKNYSQKSLLEKDANTDAIQQFDVWWNEALSAGIDEVNAMTLATATPDGVPSARIVLLKDYNKDGFVFYTNYKSFKAHEMAENPKACLVFFWKELERQVRITGLVSKVSAEASDIYFNSRPAESRLGAHVSPQSEVIENREWLDKRVIQLQKEFAGKQITRPEHWGGYLVKPVLVEFWQGRPDRLHDRLLYTMEDDGAWKIERLAP